MRKIIFFISILFIGLIACEKNTGYVDTSLEASGARVKFIHASWNAPSVIFYGRDTSIKFSSVAPTSANVVQGMAYGAVFPTAASNYMLSNTYNDSVRIRVPSNSATFPNFFAGVGKLNLQEGNYYSTFLVDSFPNVSLLTLNDTLKNFNNIPDSMYSGRFVNTIYGSPSVDVYSKRNAAVIFSNVPYKGYSRFSDFRIFPNNDTLEIRITGTSTKIAQLLNFAPGIQRTYTFFARGRYGLTTAQGPFLDFYTN